MLGLVGMEVAVVVAVATELFQNVFKPTERSSQYEVLYRSTH